MLEPLKLLHDIAAVTDAFGLWTHYYDPQVLRDKVHFSPKPVTQSFAGKSVRAYEQHYLSSVATKQFIGGRAPTSRWLTRAGLLEYIEHLGFHIDVGDEDLNIRTAHASYCSPGASASLRQFLAAIQQMP